MDDFLEIKVNRHWSQVDQHIFRSWTGLRRKNGRDFHGLVYLLGTNRLGSPQQARECQHCQDMQDALVEQKI